MSFPPSFFASSSSRSLLPKEYILINAPTRLKNFLHKIDGSAITLAHLLQHLATSNIHAMLLGPESGGARVRWCQAVATFGVYGCIRGWRSIYFHILFPKLLSPAFFRALRSFAPHAIHLVDPILFPRTLIVPSHHTNLPTYAEIFGFPYFHHRTWQIHAYLHSFARYTLVPSPSIARLLCENGWSTHRSFRASWDASGPAHVVVHSVGRLSPKKKLGLVV
ncbi:hypothetical protein B0H13DRAFT_2415290 [Mycena leptocephala]|nr:hypothetical protein B0H13DRAFT_2415290 [Mycena leptocephala]